MPCYDSRNADDIVRIEKGRQAAVRAACELADALENGKPFDLLTQETRQWVADHKANDAKGKL